MAQIKCSGFSLNSLTEQPVFAPHRWNNLFRINVVKVLIGKEIFPQKNVFANGNDPGSSLDWVPQPPTVVGLSGSFPFSFSVYSSLFFFLSLYILSFFSVFFCMIIHILVYRWQHKAAKSPSSLYLNHNIHNIGFISNCVF